jgi:uncharacterized hydrophobic protein (TIGR00271 family)
MERVLDLRHKFIESSKTTFEFYTYIINASLISAIGLMTNNSGVVIASMLISPIMNFVLSLALGILFKDWVLIRNGTKGIVISILICVTTGIGIGSFHYNKLELTNEMLLRTDGDNLYWSLLLAFFSGLSASASIMEENINNMVGVAISTSILPPLVNFGLLLPNVHSKDIGIYPCMNSLYLAVGNIVIIIVSCLFLIFSYTNIKKTRLSEMIVIARDKDLEREDTEMPQVYSS